MKEKRNGKNTQNLRSNWRFVLEYNLQMFLRGKRFNQKLKGLNLRNQKSKFLNSDN